MYIFIVFCFVLLWLAGRQGTYHTSITHTRQKQDTNHRSNTPTHRPPHDRYNTILSIINSQEQSRLQFQHTGVG